ncbi:phosphotransferase family protein [Aestuariibacter salexigens]|uniref:phosphotransferase family protein n=1 Tax=Aestuariibacter salexigens TaxID=226010 RepID=UPI000429ECF9|nr:phosphotransferase family protein [Aestuariibacter salexigens]
MPDSVQRGVDSAGEVRPGEMLPLDTLLPWLQEHIPDLEGAPHVRQYSGGASNWTYCLSFANRNIILRRAPEGTKAKGAHDMQREYHLQQALKPVYPLVPAMLGVCTDKQVLNSDFYVMEKLTGIIPRKNLPRSVTLSTQHVRQLCHNALDALIDLHQVDYQQAGLQSLGKGTGYIERQISGWSTRYRNAKTWNVPSANNIMHWLQDNMPAHERICLTHNDFRFDNLVLDPQQPENIIGVLDWELATLGDPLMDLGNMLAYWVQPDDDWLAQQTRRQPTHLEGMLTRQQVIDYYIAKTGIPIGDFTFYQVYGLFRLAGIAQQIYYRYHHKQTRNPAFKHYWIFVHYLLRRCTRLIKHAS